MQQQEAICDKYASYPTTYREVRIGKVLYRVTSVFKGEIDLKTALEDLAVRRALRESEAELEQ